MKAPKFKSTLMLIIVNVLVFTAAFAGTEEYSKNLHKEYDANANTLLFIQNKFGDIDINNWDKNQVSIDVTITVDHTNEAKAKEMLDYINVSFNQSGDRIEAITTIDDKFNRVNNFSFDKKEFSIDYKVYIPKNIKLNAENKYGSLFINEITGESVISVKYGNLKINKILRENVKPLSEVNLAYSNGTITECEWLNVNLKYSKLQIDKSKAIIAITKYSKLYVDNASSIVCESKYDEYRIGKITNFVATTAYTNFEFDQVSKKLDIDNRYGGVSVGFVPKDFELIEIENEYGDIEIKIEPGASYNINAYAKYADIDYPSNARVSKIKENTSLSVEGLIGSDSNTKSVVKVQTKYGDVELE